MYREPPNSFICLLKQPTHAFDRLGAHSCGFTVSLVWFFFFHLLVHLTAGLNVENG